MQREDDLLFWRSGGFGRDGIWGRRRRGDLAMEAATRDGVVRGFREWDAGLSFPAEFGRADLRSSNRGSHLGRAESLFSAEVGSAQVREPI
jgi:hypothetical protein